MTSVQAVDEAEQRELNGSTQESDERLEVDGTKQVTEDHFDGKEAGENGENEGSGKKKTPRTGKLWSWWRKIWPASGDLQSAVQQEKENDPRAEPDKDPDEADKKPDTCVGELDRAAKTKEQLGGPHMFHNTKYGSQDLLGMSTKVSTVNDRQGGENRQFRH